VKIPKRPLPLLRHPLTVGTLLTVKAICNFQCAYSNKHFIEILNRACIQQMKMTTIIVLFIAILSIFAAIQFRGKLVRQPEVIKNPNEPGAQYIQNLLSAIQHSDDITVTEHSNMSDYVRPDRNVDGYKEKIYQVQHVTADEKDKFIEILNALPTKTQDMFAACIFEPHHRIEFHTKGVLISTMEICFECAQVEWSGSSQTPPGSIYEGMMEFVSSIGLHPKADWYARYASQSSAAVGK